MMEKLSDRERYGIAGVFAVAIIASFGVGAAVSPGSATDTGGEASQEQVRQQVQSLMDQQVQTQRQQLRTAANQSENITMEQLSINSEIEQISQSQFDSLYRANISLTGEIPNRLGSGTQALDQSQVLYISKDGRYVFQQPTDLQRQQRGQQQPRQPAPQ